MNQILLCDLCGARGFGHLGALKAHQKGKVYSLRLKRALWSAEVTNPVGIGDGIELHGPAPSTSSVRSSHSAHDLLSGLRGNGGIAVEADLQELEETLSVSQTEKPFDSAILLLHFLRCWRSRGGLSNKDISSLLRIISHPTFDPREMPRTLGEVRRMEADLCQANAECWLEHHITFDKGLESEREFCLHYKNSLSVLEELFGAKENKKDFILQPNPGETFTTPDTGHWWASMQEHIDCEGGVVAGIILYSDQTSLSNDGRVSGYPLMMSLANIPCSSRPDTAGHALLAIFPEFATSGTGSDLTSLQKLRIFHQCLEVVLSPLKGASYSGVPIQDACGNNQWVFPMLYAYICDHPEGCKVTCTLDTNRVQLPCSLCFCGKDDLRNTNKRFPYRTETNMKAVYNDIKSATTKKEADRIAKEWSVHPVKCALWGFSGGDTELGNPYRAVNPDMLHQADLGIFKMLVEVLAKLVENNIARIQHPLRVLDERLLQLKKHHRYASFRIPGLHNMMMYLFVNWTKLQTGFSRAALQCFRPYQKSEFNTIKMHMMSHFTDAIKRSALPWEYSSNMWEHMHIALMKVAYRSTNRRKATRQIVVYHKRLEALRNAVDGMEGVEKQVVEKTTALDVAVSTGENQLSGSDWILRTMWLTGNDHVIPRTIRQLLTAQPEIGTDFLHALQTYIGENGYMGVTMCKVKTCLAIPAGVGARCGDWPMYARASRAYHGNKWYSDVAVQMEAAREKEVTWYCQLRLLFSCELRGDGGKTEKQLAFVKVYETLKQQTGTAFLTLTELKWSEGMPTTAARTKRQKRMPRYLVVEVSNILRAVYLVPNYGKQGCFWVNRFKF